MAKTNVKTSHNLLTHEGGHARHINKELQLSRSVLSCMLWENTFYEDGVSIAERIARLVPEVSARTAFDLAIDARENMKLRHVPLWIIRAMARDKEQKGCVADALERVIQRPDELTEFLSLYWLDGRQPLSAQVKKGLARAFTKFDEYKMAKYDRDGAVRLRDVLFLSHAKPKNKSQAKMWKRLIDGKLKTPDTWEVRLSSGADKKQSWTELLAENKLGGMALLRNLRNMQKARVDEDLIIEALKKMNVTRVLPFRFITAARYAPHLEPYIEVPMLKALDGFKKLPGTTALLVDVSGSMFWHTTSAQSETKLIDAASGLAILARELCEKAKIYSFSDKVVPIPNRRGFALRDAVVYSQDHSGTYLGAAVKEVERLGGIDRLIVITDEQSHDRVPDPETKLAYMVNVASYQNGVGYGAWTHIDGWSEAIFSFITELEELVG